VYSQTARSRDANKDAHNAILAMDKSQRAVKQLRVEKLKNTVLEQSRGSRKGDTAQSPSKVIKRRRDYFTQYTTSNFSLVAFLELERDQSKEDGLVTQRHNNRKAIVEDLRPRIDSLGKWLFWGKQDLNQVKYIGCNPSVTTFYGGGGKQLKLMVSRLTPSKLPPKHDLSTKALDFIGVSVMDAEFNHTSFMARSLSTMQLRKRDGSNNRYFDILSRTDPNELTSSGPPNFNRMTHHLVGEDPKVFSHSNTTYLVFNHVDAARVSHWRFMCFAPVHFDPRARVFYVDVDELVIMNSTTAVPLAHEKNWTPFSYNGSLYFSYSILPHHVVMQIQGANLADPNAHQARVAYRTHNSDLTWRYGHVRGGTPAIALNATTNIAMFHSSVLLRPVVRTYFMGIYLFSSRPPFEITAISRRPIVADGFYSGSWVHSFVDYVVYPGSMELDDEYIWCVYGRQDAEGWVAKINRTEALNDLNAS
jgi:predicted GH43/DUF377 family glycosyl hydrolase